MILRDDIDIRVYGELADFLKHRAVGLKLDISMGLGAKQRDVARVQARMLQFAAGFDKKVAEAKNRKIARAARRMKDEADKVP